MTSTTGCARPSGPLARQTFVAPYLPSDFASSSEMPSPTTTACASTPMSLALAYERAALDVDLDDLRQRRHLQVIGDDRADRVALAVVRLLAQQHQVGLLALEHLRERVARGGDVRAGEALVGQVDRAVRAERNGLVKRAEGALRSHRDGDDLVDVGV